MMTDAPAIETRLANALIPDAQASEQVLSAAGAVVGDMAGIASPQLIPVQGALSSIVSGTMRSELNWFRKRWGGLWVGGKVTLTSTSLSFEPNEMNVVLHSSPQQLGWAIPLTEITAVLVRRGVITNIIDVQSSSGKVSFRCYRAKSFAARIERERQSRG